MILIAFPVTLNHLLSDRSIPRRSPSRHDIEREMPVESHNFEIRETPNAEFSKSFLPSRDVNNNIRITAQISCSSKSDFGHLNIGFVFGLIAVAF